MHQYHTLIYILAATVRPEKIELGLPPLEVSMKLKPLPRSLYRQFFPNVGLHQLLVEIGVDFQDRIAVGAKACPCQNKGQQAQIHGAAKPV